MKYIKFQQSKIPRFINFLRVGFFVFILSFSSTTVYANLPKERTLDFFDRSSIYYYNPENKNNSCAPSTITTLAGNTSIEKIWNFFTQQGFNDAQVAGILGNIQAESGFSPTRASSSSYWGLFQWGGGRKDKVQEKIKTTGLAKYLDSQYWGAGADKSIPENDYNQLLQIELEHAMSETDMDWQTELKTTNTPEEAAEIFLVLFERAVNGKSPIIHYSPFKGKLYQHTNKRRDYAKSIYQKYSNHETTQSNNSYTASDNCNIDSNLSNLVLEYAWPNFHNAPYINRRPAYAAAVTAAQNEGRFVGGSVNGVAGIDCGGFVTILTQDSGLAINYNDTKGATPAQEKWVIDHGWTLLNFSNTTAIDTSILRPGDIAFSGGVDYRQNGHTFIYVGNIPGFNSNIASASYSPNGTLGRAPMAGSEDLIRAESSFVRWYRKTP